jgi:hypothetical protein
LPSNVEFLGAVHIIKRDNDSRFWGGVMNRLAPMFFGLVVLALMACAAPAGDKGEKKADPPLLILDAQGKEVMLKGWHLVGGTRRLDGVDGSGPRRQYLEFREEKSTTFQVGILTLVPTTALRKLDYNYEKKTVTAVVAVAGGKDETLVGTTRFNGINRLGIEGDADLGKLGFASVKFQAGNPKGGITGVRFPAAQPAFEVKGDTAVVIATDKEKTRHTVADLTALYHVNGGVYRALPVLMFKKTVKIDLAKIASMRHVASEDKKQTAYDFEVVLHDGTKHTLTLLTKVELEGTKAATFVGLLGRVAVGYKLFPTHTIGELKVDNGGKK